MRVRSRLFGCVVCSALALSVPALANDTTFTYQGSLRDGGAPANGAYDATFALYSAATGGTLLGTDGVGFEAVNGLFTVELDFGPAGWNNADRWLQITINGSTLSPRQPVTRAPYAITTRGINVNQDGQVGIGGVATTSNMLTIRDEDANVLLLSQGNSFGPKLTFRNTSSSAIGTVHGNIIFDNGSQLAAIGYVKPAIGPDGLQISGANNVHMKILANGNIGLGGELDALSPLHLRGTDLSLSASALHHDDIVVETDDAVLGLYSSPGGTRGSAVVLAETSGGALVDKWGIGRNTSGSGSALYFKYGANADYSTNQTMFVMEPGGDVYVPAGIRLGVGTANPATALHVVGNARVNVLEVVGADLAERFPSLEADELKPGMVVEIDPENAGHLRLSSSAYSGLVAGVVSGAGGLPAGTIMGNLPGHESAPAVALSGRVWVYCDATENAIAPGNLLTSSATPGHAMRATDNGRAQGAVIGKAMTGLEQGQRGLVLVLVGLR